MHVQSMALYRHGVHFEWLTELFKQVGLCIGTSEGGHPHIVTNAMEEHWAHSLERRVQRNDKRAETASQKKRGVNSSFSILFRVLFSLLSSHLSHLILSSPIISSHLLASPRISSHLLASPLISSHPLISSFLLDSHRLASSPLPLSITI